MPSFMGKTKHTAGSPERQSSFGWAGHNPDADLAAARAIKLTEEDALPAAQRQPPPFDVNCLRDAGECGLDVRVCVSFPVLVRPALGHEAVERRFDVPGNVRVVALVDGDPGGGMRHIEVAEAVGDTGSGDNLFDVGSDIHELGAPRAFYFEQARARPRRGSAFAGWAVRTHGSNVIKRRGARTRTSS